MVVRLRRLRTNSSAPTTSTSDSATWSTTSARRSPKRSRVSELPRLPAFIAAPGAVPVTRIAGISPKTRQVATASAAVKAKMRQSSARFTKIGALSLVRKFTRNRLSHCASRAPQTAPNRRDQQALGQQLADDAPARRADRQPHGDLALARGGARQHQVREIRAGDEQHEAGRGEQQPQRRLVGPPERRHAGPGLEGAELELEVIRRVLGAVARAAGSPGRLARRSTRAARWRARRSNPASAGRTPPGTRRPTCRGRCARRGSAARRRAGWRRRTRARLRRRKSSAA